MKKALRISNVFSFVGILILLAALAASCIAAKGAEESLPAHRFWVVSDMPIDEACTPIEDGRYLLSIDVEPYSTIHAYRTLEASYDGSLQIYDGDVFISMLWQKARLVLLLLAFALLAMAFARLRTQYRMLTTQMKATLPHQYLKAAIKENSALLAKVLLLFIAWLAIFLLVIYTVPFEPVFTMPYSGLRAQITNFLLGENFLPAFALPQLQELVVVSQLSLYLSVLAFAFLLCISAMDKDRLHK